MSKCCNFCENIKPISDFYKKKDRKDGLSSKCKMCALSDQKRYNFDNKNQIKEKMAVYYQENQEKLKMYGKKNREMSRLRDNFKFSNDVQFRIKKTLRARFNQALKNTQKTGSAIQDLGCSIEKLKKYLESMFKDGMSWDNHGEWHIDHIKPLSSFDLTQESAIKEACNYKNLQPLWAMDNLKKSNKVEVENV